MRRVSPPVCDTCVLFAGSIPSSSPILTFLVGPRHIPPLLFVYYQYTPPLLAPTSRAIRDEDTPFGSSSEQEVQERNAALLRGDFRYLHQYAQQAIPEGGQTTEALRQAIAHVVPAIMPAHIAVWSFTSTLRRIYARCFPGSSFQCW